MLLCYCVTAYMGLWELRALGLYVGVYRVQGGVRLEENRMSHELRAELRAESSEIRARSLGLEV